MSKLHTIPKADGFHMPAEYAPHHGTIMIFPERRGSWSNVPKAQEIFSCIIREIAKSETVYVLVSEAQRTRAEELLSGDTRIRLLTIPQNDAWARDTAPTFVVNDRGELRGIDWQFNAGAESLTDSMPIGRRTTPLLAASAKASVWTAMMHSILCWRAVRFILTVRGRFSLPKAACSAPDAIPI